MGGIVALPFLLETCNFRVEVEKHRRGKHTYSTLLYSNNKLNLHALYWPKYLVQQDIRGLNNTTNVINNAYCTLDCPTSKWIAECPLDITGPSLVLFVILVNMHQIEIPVPVHPMTLSCRSGYVLDDINASVTGNTNLEECFFGNNINLRLIFVPRGPASNGLDTKNVHREMPHGKRRVSNLIMASFFWGYRSSASKTVT